ncbi:MAG TPA: hypothetical protein EYQ50_04940 [Verrucomicrobiales bacterium]|nr:hypothetical protein [Verrucomicrobiales bacterium]HIL71459.1 hypothetical protein [Verrucomicrobiota bacterium]
MKEKNIPSQTDDAHLNRKFGWWALLVFLSGGLVLEILHGLKVSGYLSVSVETRRLMWTLSHSHGTLMAIINIVFSLSLPSFSNWKPTNRRLASRCLIGASILMPGGFFLGGVTIYDGDPGLGILLVPVGGLMLVASILLTAMASTKSNK